MPTPRCILVGTAFNALTNPQGYYFLNNVPARTVSVRAAFIGYKSTQVEGVKVLAGQTITVDVQLEQTAVQLTEITVVTQTQPLVPRDEVTTKQRIDGQFADNLPVDRINARAEAAAGRDRGQQRQPLDPRRPQQRSGHVRGRRAGPGRLPWRSVRRLPRRPEISIGTNAFEEASVTTGSSSAEFGNAKSGIISIVTKTGGSNYQGSFSLESDSRSV